MSQKMLSSFWTGVSLHVYLDCVVEVGDVDIQSYNDAQWCFFSNSLPKQYDSLPKQYDLFTNEKLKCKQHNPRIHYRTQLRINKWKCCEIAFFYSMVKICLFFMAWYRRYEKFMRRICNYLSRTTWYETVQLCRMIDQKAAVTFTLAKGK